MISLMIAVKQEDIKNQLVSHKSNSTQNGKIFSVQDQKENLPQRLRDTENFKNEFITLLSFY